jgi:DNA-binding transcriptional LysR family regulator
MAFEIDRINQANDNPLFRNQRQSMAKPSRNLDLNALHAFAAVAEAQGFTAAAERTGLTKTRLSLDVARLEKQLRSDLFTRTTRRVRLTEAGQKLYAECVPLIRKVEATADQLSTAPARLTGTLRITATVDQANQSLAQAVAAFAAIHTELNIELVSSDRVVNLVKEGIDLAFRMGWLRDSSMRALKLAEFEQYVVASPHYLASAGVPAKPEDLESHAWIALTRLPTPLTWKFIGPNGERRTVRMSAKLRVDTGSTLRVLLENGAGLSTLESIGSAEAIQSGRLQRVLTKWSLPNGGIYAVFPPGKHLAPAARAFVEFYRERFRRK